MIERKDMAQLVYPHPQLGDPVAQDTAADQRDADRKERLEVMREWHLSRAAMASSVETRTRHEEFADWLTELING